MVDHRRHARAPKHRSIGQRLLLACMALATIGTVAAAGVVVWVYATVGALPRFSEEEVAVRQAPPGEPANYLIVGSDSRENMPEPEDPDDAVLGQRSDTIMVARIDPQETEVNIVSFPRDLWVPLANGRTDRINAAYGEGRQVLIDTIEQNFGITINHYIEVDFLGFMRMVDAIGGVPIYFDTTYRDTRTFLRMGVGPGCVTLDGEGALGFARSRHLERLDEDGDWESDPTGDLGRITRQQFFIRRALEKILTLNPFTNPITFTNLLEEAVDSVKVDAGLSTDDLRQLADDFDGFSPETIINHSLPTEGFRTDGGASVLDLVEGPETDAVLNIFRGLDPGEVVPSQVAVRVHNGSGAERQGTNTAEALAAVGFDAAVLQDTEHHVATTVYYAPGSEAAARLVARHLTSRAVYVVDEELDGNQIELVTGDDFTTVVREPWSEDDVDGPPEDGPARGDGEGAGTTTTTSEPDSGSTSSSSSSTSTTSTTTVGFLPAAPEDVDC
jgi:LCP family protein required for cell wall assembly